MRHNSEGDECDDERDEDLARAWGEKNGDLLDDLVNFVVFRSGAGRFLLQPSQEILKNVFRLNFKIKKSAENVFDN